MDHRNMKAELIIPPEIIELIAESVMTRLLPHLPHERAEDEIMTIGEVAALLKKSEAQIYQWVSNSRHRLGSFPYMKVGKSLRFSRNEIIQWAKSNAGR